MLTDNLYNFRMDYPGPLLHQYTTNHPITPPYSNAYDAPPQQQHQVPSPLTVGGPHRSAFSAVKSSSAATAATAASATASTIGPYSSAELLQQFYRHQKNYYAGYFASTPMSAVPTASATAAASCPQQQQLHYPLTSLTPPHHRSAGSSHIMIDQLLLQQQTPQTAGTASTGILSPAQSSSSSSASSSTSDEPEPYVNIADDSEAEAEDSDEDHDDEDDDDDVVICVDDDHMDRQCRAMIQRTTVIKSVIANDDLYASSGGAYVAAAAARMQRAGHVSSSSAAAPNGAGQQATSTATLAADEESIVCKWSHCFRHFDSLEQLATHVTLTHAIASPAGLYYCQWHHCPRAERGFNARYKMLVHVRTHTKEKPHRCQQCDKSFSRAENLKIHTRSHSGEKPYVCPVAGCTKAYSNSSDRFKHTRTHSTEKPYSCKVAGCNKRYTDPSSLRKHVKTFKHSAATAAAAGGEADCGAAATAMRPTFEDMVRPYRLADSQMGVYGQQQRQPDQHHRLMNADMMIDLSPPEAFRYEPLHRIAGLPTAAAFQHQYPTTSSATTNNTSMLQQHLGELMLHDARHLHRTVAHDEPEAEEMVSVTNVEVRPPMEAESSSSISCEEDCSPLDLSMSSVGSSSQ